MVQIAPLDRSHLPQVLALVNSHLSTVIPGWSLTADYFWERLKSEPQVYRPCTTPRVDVSTSVEVDE